MTRETTRGALPTAATLTACLFVASGAGYAEDLRIKEAKWEGGDHRLVVKGEGPRDEQVTVMNAGDRSVLGTTRSDDEGDGEWRFRKYLDVPPCRVRAEADGEAHERSVENAGSNCDSGSQPPEPPEPPPSGETSINSTSANALAAGEPVPEEPIVAGSQYKVLAANDLGMHCADLDYQVFSILPPFNVVHAQVVKRGTRYDKPRIMDDTNIEVTYSAASSPTDPALDNDAVAPIDKSNFWETAGTGYTRGYDTYAPLFFGLLKPTDIARQDVGLPVFDSVLLRACLQPYLDKTATADETRAACAAAQQSMPGVAGPYDYNDPQTFDRFDHSVNFFNELLGPLGLGGIVEDVNWFAADGIPILPIDDQGRSNAYPLMRIAAVNKATESVLSTTDIVLPVASEADCQLCHAAIDDLAMTELGFDGTGAAVEFASEDFDVARSSDLGAPGSTVLNKLQNAAKINILRLHDAKHGTSLDASRPVQCATCHYTPALDLAQLGPMGKDTSPIGGVEQRSHISMSRAMHGHHGTLPADPDLPYDPETNSLFPDMPGPDGRAPETAANILDQTCYQCHPGKQTKCLRGAMEAGGVVCQDCHGQSRHVGNDFSEALAATDWPDGANFNKRIPWASEPGCQSCHTGDAVNKNHPAGAVVAADGIRLLQAYTLEPGKDASGSDDGTEVAKAISSPGSRFAENEALYRVSKGHGGIMCEGCHGSTHAIFPNPKADANDNVAAVQLQGHVGTITECSTCHEGSLGLTLDGPHGMHPVGDRYWNKEHEEIAERNSEVCQTCHGANGEGTVLSRTAAERTWECKDEKGTECSREDQIITVPAGTVVSCTQCHENEIGGGSEYYSSYRR